MPGLSWVLPKLAVSGADALWDLRSLANEHRIRLVVDLRAEARHDPKLFASHGLQLLRLPVGDHQPLSISMLDRGVDWVMRGLAQGEAALVHCQHGIGRSVLLASCILIAHGHTPVSAIQAIKTVRPIASPSPPQLTALLEWATHHCSRNSRPTPDESWEQLAAIAYSHLDQGKP
jgi:protein-tyrosine phosphatase